MAELIISMLTFAALSAAMTYLFWRGGFFVLPKGDESPPMTLINCLLLFAVYLAVALALPFTLYHYCPLITIFDRFVLMAFLNTCISLLSIVAVYLLAIKRTDFPRIWNFGQQKTLTSMGMGALTYLAAFPIVSFTNQGLELFNLFFFQRIGPDQNAVQYLKTSSDHPIYSILALMTIVVIAPFVEELLFRGVLQTYVKQFLGKKAAILVSSLAFAALHYASNQGIGNIPLLGSLFIFALYLGFIYERQQALIANITLHVVFNAISASRIFLME